MFVGDSEQMKQIDFRAVNKYGIPEIILMENAANAIYNHIVKMNFKKALVVCGGGNNGGDGFALSRLLHSRGYGVNVFCAVLPEKMSPSALTNYRILENTGVSIFNNIEDLKNQIPICDLIVDALFGTGLKGNVKGIYIDIIKAINESDKQIVSIDIPSGVDSDTGEKLGCCIYARATITFCCYKFGHLLGEGRQASGEVFVENISIPQECILEQYINTYTCFNNYPLCLIKKREVDSHKGDYGRVFIIGGSFEMSGAVALTAKAASRSGAGLVTCVIPKEIIDRVGSIVPETTFLCMESRNGLIEIPEEKLDLIMSKADVIAIGPGLGTSQSNVRILEYILMKWSKPLVIDADAITMLSRIKEKLKESNAKVIITPHPGEMSRLTGLSIEEVNSRRLKVARDFAKVYNCTVLLKGASTVVSDGENTYINTTGNPGMASGGSGDVLTGIVAALAAQGYNEFEACILGSFVHGKAGDEACKDFGNGLTASDIADYLAKGFKQ